MNQNNIQSILKRNSIIPVVTFNKIEEIDNVIKDLKNQNIHCIEVTLRTSIAFNAIEYIKDKYATEICIGAGTGIVIGISVCARRSRRAGVGVSISVGVGISSS